MASTALVTGGNRGIGQEVARCLARDGWDVLVGARDRSKGDAAAKRLREATGGRLRAVELDVASEESVATAAQKLRDGAIRLDALVNNAGVYRSGAILETNFFGALRTTLAMLPLLNDGASITMVTSDLGALSSLAAEHRRALTDPALTRDALVDYVRGAGWSGDYGASKAALNALARVLARGARAAPHPRQRDVAGVGAHRHGRARRAAVRRGGRGERAVRRDDDRDRRHLPRRPATRAVTPA